MLLEHLAAVAREHGIHRFVAWTMANNAKMLGVFAAAGFEVHRSFDAGTIEVSFDIEPTPTSLDAQRAREHSSEATSMLRLLAPSSVAVIGASRRSGTIGNGLFRNLLDGDFQGPVYPVNPTAGSVAGVRAYPKVTDVPDHVDLAIVCVPAVHVRAVAEDCVRKGVGGLVVISAGFAEIDAEHGASEHQLVELARGNGMRIIGPNCMGVVNTNPDVRMNATFAPFAPTPGRLGFASQSGGLGIELLARSAELGLGISTFVSMGNKADVSSNDLLQYWEEDPETDVILLYLESFGNPRKFARLARRIARKKPIIAVKSGRTPAGERGTSSHTAALASPRRRRRRAVPSGRCDPGRHPRGAVRHGERGLAPAVATRPARCDRQQRRRARHTRRRRLRAAGLEVPELAAETQAALRSFVSPDAGVRNPVDLVASGRRHVRAGIEDAHQRPSRRRHHRDLRAAARDARRRRGRCRVSFRGGRRRQAGDRASSLGRHGTLGCCQLRTGWTRRDACRRSRSRKPPRRRWVARHHWPIGARAPTARFPSFADVQIGAARQIVTDGLARSPEGTWLDSDAGRDLLACFGVAMAPTVLAANADAAADEAGRLGFPVVLKAASGAIVHKTDVGAVRLRSG